jgi:hypothetical protein
VMSVFQSPSSASSIARRIYTLFTCHSIRTRVKMIYCHFFFYKLCVRVFLSYMEQQLSSHACARVRKEVVKSPLNLVIENPATVRHPKAQREAFKLFERKHDAKGRRRERSKMQVSKVTFTTSHIFSFIRSRSFMMPTVFMLVCTARNRLTHTHTYIYCINEQQSFVFIALE